MARSLIPIPNQPLRFFPYPEVYHCKKREPYCFLHQPDDPIRVQFKQQPCGENLLCGLSSEGPAVEMATNGSFTGSAAGWSFISGNATYGSNKVTFGAGGTDTVYQPIAWVSGRTYQVRVTVSGMTQGQLDILSASGLTWLIGSITSDGTYTFLYTAQPAVSNILFSNGFNPSPLFDGSIDDVSIIQEFNDCWDYSNGSNFTISGSSICHVPGVASTITNSGVLTVGVYYKIQIKISGRTQGNVIFKAGTKSGATITSNGTFTQYLTCEGSGDFTLEMNADFDGCVTLLTAYELRNDFAFYLQDLDGNIVADLSSYVHYENEYVNLGFDGINIIPSLPHAGGTLPPDYGCYKILISDECAANYGYYCGEDADYISNCIRYQESFDTTYLVIGNNNPDSSVKKYAFGFLFSSGFYLVQRLNIGFRKPKYPSKFDKGKYSNQVHYKNYVEKDKVWEMVFGECSEIEHDAIDVQIDCREFGFIKDGCIYTYFNITEEYSPEWDTKGQRELAESRIEVMASGDTLITSLLPVLPSSFLLLEDGGAILLED